jgi:hypothetical protein
MNSSRTELVPSYRGRPPVIRRDGWTEFVAIHDQGYYRNKKSWKRKLATLHPDHGGSAASFRSARAKYETWLLRERHYYWKLDLMPPDWRGSVEPPPGFVVTSTGSLLPAFVR